MMADLVKDLIIKSNDETKMNIQDKLETNEWIQI